MRFIIFILIFLSNLSFSQQTISYEEVDSSSYADYMNNDFKKIKKIGKKALKENIDFYYLRMRLGIVAYNKKNYEYALPHFEQANAMNPADSIVQEYLYFSYLFSDRTENASALAEKLSDSFRKKVAYQTKKIDHISLGFMTFLNDNIEKNKLLNLVYPNFIRGDVDLNGSTYGENVMLQFTRKNRFHFYNKFSCFQTNQYGIEQLATPLIKQRESRTYHNTQYQFNTGFSYNSQKGYLFSMGLGFFQTNMTHLASRITFPGIVQFDNIQNQYNNVLASLIVGKQMKYIFPTISTTYSNLFDVNQFQGELSLTYYPFGNTKFYGTSSYALINNNQNNQEVFTQKIGFRCFKWLWFEGKYSVGNHSNYTTDNGFIAYNSADHIKLNIGIDAHIYINKIEFVLAYAYQTREAIYNQYLTPVTFNQIKYNYSNNNLGMILKWNF